MKIPEFSVDCNNIVRNPSAASLWISVSGQTIEIKAGELKNLEILWTNKLSEKNKRYKTVTNQIN